MIEMAVGVNELVVNNPSDKISNINITINKYNTSILSLYNLNIMPNTS